MKRFIIALILLAAVFSAMISNRVFIGRLYEGIDEKIAYLESISPLNDIKAVDELDSFWQSKTHILSLSVKESEIRGFSVLLAKMKACKGEEYLSALANVRLLAEELHKTESMAFFDLF